MNTLNKEVWLEEGMRILIEEGFARIVIDNLCKRLGITKGSFYHHFKNIDGYVTALMEYWMEKNTLEIMRRIESSGRGAEKLLRLEQTSLLINHKGEFGIRGWCHSHPTVREYVQRVDRIRMDFLTGIYLEMGYEQERARDLAVLEYAVVIGIQHILTEVSQDELARLQKVHFERIEKT